MKDGKPVIIEMKAVPSPTAAKVMVSVSEDGKYLETDGVTETKPQGVE
jgi:hypothetical protein